MGYKLRIDMAGERYGRLVGLAFSHRSRCGHAQWTFRCDCGLEVVASGGNVRSGNTTSCGCIHRETSAARLTVHGRRAAGRHDPTYRAWQFMNDSCVNPRSPGWKRCGASGVAVCAAWRSDYSRFHRDMGERPTGSVLARISDESDFTPQTCVWRLSRTAYEVIGEPREPRISPGRENVGAT